MSLRNPIGAPALISPLILGAIAAATPTVSNTARFMRFSISVPGVYRYINWVIGVASGNIQVGVVALSGTGHTTFTPVVSSGVITCPTAGDIRTDLGVFTLQPGDYALFFWSDNTTVTTYRSTSMAAASKLCGTLASLASGVIAPGTLAWGGVGMMLTLEADV